MRKTPALRRPAAIATVAALAATGLSWTASAAGAADTELTLFDFESGTSSHIQWGDAGAGVEAYGAITPPDADPNTHMLSYGFNLLSGPNYYGGMGFEFGGGQPAQNWASYDGVQFWLYGDGKGGTLQIELLDAVSADPGVYDRYDTVIPVGDAGWRLVQVPFADFQRAIDYQDGGAPNDGSLDLTYVRGVLFPANSGEGVVKIDDIGLYAGAAVAPSVGVQQTALNVTEGADAVIPVTLNRAADSDVTVDYSTADGTGVAGTDYTAASGTVTIPAGETTASITVPTTGNDLADGNRTFTVSLSNAAGATLGTDVTTVTIRDDDAGTPTGPSEPGVMVEDFESELILGDSAAVPPLGWFAVAGSSNIPTFARQPDATVPGTTEDNDALEIGLDTSSWAVVIDNFTPDGETWVPQDWSAHNAVGFWMKGTNSGAPMFIDILDNRNPDSQVDDAERYSVRFADDFSGWKFIELPFSQFTRKNIGNGAPDDGFTLTEVHGFGIGVEQTSSRVAPVIRIDDLQLIGTAEERPVTINMARATFPVTEGEAARVEVRLTRAADEDVTMSFRTEEATDRTSTEDPAATPERDYVSTSGELTIPAGERSAFIEVATIDDAKPEVDETFLVRLSDAVGAELNPLAVARVSIADNDAATGTMLEDFEDGIGLLRPTGGAELSDREVAASDVDSYPGQDDYETVLDMVGAGGFERTLQQPQDWTGQDGIGMWFYGQGDGDPVTVTVHDDGAADAGPADWELAWSDEFDADAGTPADPRYWTYETGGWGWGNDELQYYSDSTDNAAHDGDGNMVITTRKVEDPAASGLECWYGPCEYTSARLITEGKVEAKHGRIEARAKMPDGEPGIWPAIWTLGNDFRDVGWPRTGEIDIMEYVGKLPNEIFGTIHGPGYSGGQAYGDTYDFGEDLSGQWLTFSIEWEEGEIRWYVQRDGGEEFLFHTATPEDVAPSDWVFEHPFTMLMNMAVGGNFGGPLGADLEFPQQLLVDYIRVYQAPDTAERFEATFADDTAGWRFVEVPFDAFERSATQPAGAPNDGLTLTAVRGYGVSTASAGGDGARMLALAADGVSLDRLQLLADVTDPVDPVDPGDGGGVDGGGGGNGNGAGNGGGVDGGGGGNGNGAGNGNGNGNGGGNGNGNGVAVGGLAETGGGDATLGFALGLLLTALGAITLLRRKFALVGR
ncbi:carbohydrate binding domain-containing protein [Microbacterium aureliae]